MQRHNLLLLAVLMATSLSATAEVKIPKSIIIDLIESRCDNPDPNPRKTAALEYDCSEKYEDDDGEQQSMNYSLRLHPLLAMDFNQDSIEDLAIEVESMGPLGGSVFSNSTVEYLLLDSKKQIVGSHEILLYAPFSEHIVTYKVLGKQINYSAVPNFRSHPEAYEDGELIDPALKFTVNWQGDNPISSYYRDHCRLANSKDKGLLDLSLGGASNVDIDMHEYTQVVTETVQIKGLDIEATLSGCDLSSVTYVITAQQGHSLPVLSEVLKILVPVAHNSKPLITLQKLEQRSELKFAEKVPLYKGWQGYVFVDRKDKIANIRIIIEQIK